MSDYTTQEDFRPAYDTLHATFRSGKTKSLKWRKWQLKQFYWLADENEQALQAAIKHGNCAMLKPSEQTSATLNFLAELLSKYMDQSAIRIVTGGGPETDFMLEHKFDMIFYTGGSRIGCIVATAAAKHLTPCVLELGGQAPTIVCKTADIELAAKRITGAKMMNNGQTCLSVNHVFVDPSIHDQFVDRVIDWTRKRVTEATPDELYKIVNSTHYARIQVLLDNTSGSVAYNGDSNPDTRFMHPAVITDVTISDSLMSEEIFGLLLPITKADMSEAIATVTSMPHPLGLYIFSSSQAEIDHILSSTTSGGVTINDSFMHVVVPGAPFGDVGDSGYGYSQDKWRFESFSHTRTVVTIPGYLDMLLGFRHPPYDNKNKKTLLVKARFRKGETMDDQTIGGHGSVRTWATRFAIVTSCWRAPIA